MRTSWRNYVLPLVFWKPSVSQVLSCFMCAMMFPPLLMPFHSPESYQWPLHKFHVLLLKVLSVCSIRFNVFLILSLAECILATFVLCTSDLSSGWNKCTCKVWLGICLFLWVSMVVLSNNTSVVFQAFIVNYYIIKLHIFKQVSPPWIIVTYVIQIITISAHS